LNQTYQNREIIVIDDGSTDNTCEAVSRFAKEVKYVYQENKKDKIIDQDFFDFFKSSVRTKPLELLGNISQIDNTISEHLKINKKISTKLKDYSTFLKMSFIHLYEGVKK
jgi:cellulose synthase/poly-beta-1,6-N-acetylglucosamine synthase-like glycosyltransferase